MAIIKKDNLFIVRISYKKGGKYHTKYKSGFTTREQAEEYAQYFKKYLREPVQDKNNKETKVTLYHYFYEWYSTFIEPKITYNTKRHYKTVLKIIKVYFKNKKLCEVTRTDYQKFINWYGSNHVKATVNKMHYHIKAMVNNAILDGVLTKDFTQSINIVYSDKNKKSVDYLNLKEIKTIIKYLFNSIDTNKRTNNTYIFLLTGFLTGMRLGEIQALTWNDVNFDTCKIDINKSWDCYNYKFKKTKTKASNRVIVIPNNLAKILKHKKETDKPNSRNLIFYNGGARCVPESSNINRALRRLFKRLNINRKNYHFHSVRHSFVALTYSLGIDMYAISRHLGHANITITMNTYSYLLEEFKEEQEHNLVNSLTKIYK
ncbi:tyrosine-type recombinase/integrase [Ligilactobacillus cholophilus]|uniref:tyrosine-type recombinase/integrase n=1 Tax=Ligilactobacillus cholophilus TaxID=3050131 RepID=UPI0025B1BF89|nr:site-specific integrase [Ligilactobacillus cholophilus]